MSVSRFGILLVLVSTVVEGSAQVCLKKSSLNACRPLWITGGIILFILHGLLYTYALQWLDVSTAYPLGALSFVVVSLLSSWLLAEKVTSGRWTGVAFIVIGCVLIALKP